MAIAEAVNHKLDPLNVSAPGGRISGVGVGCLVSGGTIMALFDVGFGQFAPTSTPSIVILFLPQGVTQTPSYLRYVLRFPM